MDDGKKIRERLVFALMEKCDDPFRMYVENRAKDIWNFIETGEPTVYGSKHVALDDSMLKKINAFFGESH